MRPRGLLPLNQRNPLPYPPRHGDLPRPLKMSLVCHGELPLGSPYLPHYPYGGRCGYPYGRVLGLSVGDLGLRMRPIPMPLRLYQVGGIRPPVYGQRLPRPIGLISPMGHVLGGLRGPVKPRKGYVGCPMGGYPRGRGVILGLGYLGANHRVARLLVVGLNVL